MTRKPEDIRMAIDTTLSGASHDPTLYHRVVNASKGDSPPVKRKLTLSMALVLILALMTGTVAVAATYRGVSWFLTEKTCEPITLDADYLLSGLQQHHNSKYLNAAVVDAYWDGLNFSIAYHISPADPTHFIQMDCRHPEHDHYRPVEDADILLSEPEFINITDENGNITRPQSYSSNWVYEDDGSLTAMISFNLYNMSQPVSISIPIFNTLTSTGELFRSMLHCNPPTLADPIAAHEHQWTPATCVSPEVCSICYRTGTELGYHTFQPSEDEDRLICAVCGSSTVKPFNVPATVILRPGDNNVFVLSLQLRLRDLGFYAGIFSGVYDDATTAAVKAYQERQGLFADGVCGVETLKLLFP